jgi:CheY-like chemotaxis protein
MDVVTATNGRKAVEIAATTPNLSVVLMDIMPDMDGYETTRTIRNDPRFRALPILALTAKAGEGEGRKCLDAGANDYLSKPVNTDQLSALMRRWLSR